MRREIRPEPTDAERRAILRALARARRSPYESAWRRAGLDYAATPPRQTRGARRA
jgi:hypothetical protein